ncbi:MAG: hypothetical protein JO197_17335 [Acidobacteria bacterium]|nr:hypothetical protein [Acidobacteriota bacterium]
MRRAVLVVLLATLSLHAQDSPLAAALRANGVPFTIENGQLGGAGAAFFRQLAREHQFIIIGEDHGIHEVPEFVGAAFDLARRDANYRHLGIELGPETARQLETMLRKPSGQDDLKAFLTRYTGFSLPFANWREEAQLFQRVVQSLPDEKHVLWGLDQEFIVAPSYLFESLARMAPNDEARTLATNLAASSLASDRRMIAEANPQAVWMVTSTDADVAALQKAFANATPAARALLDEIVQSRAIYRAIFSGKNYESNRDRAELMKRHFAAEYEAARRAGEAAPRVMLKFGSNHAFRGVSGTSTYELGSFLPELAIANGSHACNVLLVHTRGTQNMYRPFGSKLEDQAKPFADGGSDSDNDVLDVRAARAIAGDAMMMFDLRPVRAAAQNRKLGKLDPPVLRLLQAFDVVVVLPVVHASALIVPPAEPSH